MVYLHLEPKASSYFTGTKERDIPTWYFTSHGSSQVKIGIAPVLATMYDVRLGGKFDFMDEALRMTSANIE